MLYIKNARECLTMISKHEKAYEAQGAIIIQVTKNQIIYAQRNGKCKLMWDVF